MSHMRCEDARERIPDLAAGRLPPLEAEPLKGHLELCDECREEMEVVALLGAGRPAAPADFVAVLEGAVRARRPAATRPWWGLAAAAVAALALGIGVMSDGDPAVADLPAIVAGTGEVSLGLADDGWVAGEPDLGALSDEALTALLDDMAASPAGGAA